MFITIIIIIIPYFRIFWCRQIFATLGQTAIVLFWPVVVTLGKINTIVCSDACDKHVSFLCVVFGSENIQWNKE